jgi:hypothetical protein
LTRPSTVATQSEYAAVTVFIKLATLHELEPEPPVKPVTADIAGQGIHEYGGDLWLFEATRNGKRHHSAANAASEEFRLTYPDIDGAQILSAPCESAPDFTSCLSDTAADPLHQIFRWHT